MSASALVAFTQTMDTPGAPEPLFPPLEVGSPFPVEHLPEPLRAGVNGVVAHVQCPVALAAQSILAAASLVAQMHVNAPMHTGVHRPASLFFVTVAASGERKSSADSLACRAIEVWERERSLQHEIDLDAFKREKAAWDAAEKKAKTGKKTYEAIRAALAELPEEPKPPLLPMVRCQEPTLEGLWRLLAHNCGAAGVFSAEGGEFLSGHAMNKDNRMKSAAALSTMWDGESLTRVRVLDGASALLGRRVSVHLMVQPELGATLITDRALRDQGLLSRFLVAAPASTQGLRFFTEPSSDDAAMLEQWHETLARLLQRPLPIGHGRNTLDPRKLSLAYEAKAMLIAFSDRVERELGPDGPLDVVAGFANKLAEQAARLAAVFAFMERPDGDEVTAEHIAAGIEVAKWYEAEQLRLVSAGRVDPGLRNAQKLLDWLHSEAWPDTLVSSADVQQRGPASLRQKKLAENAIAVLVDHSWLIPLDGPQTIQGKRRRQAYTIVKETS